MKKMIFLALIGVLLLALAACNNESTTDNAARHTTGRYVEIDISPPIDGWFMNILTQDGTLVAFDEGLRTRYDSIDNGATWVQSAGPGIGTDRFMGVRTAAFLPDGRLLAYVQGDGMTTIAADGATEHFPIADIDNSIADGDSHIVSLIQVLDDNQVLLTYSIDWIARFMSSGDFQTSFGPGEIDSGSFEPGTLDLDGLDIESILAILGIDPDEVDLENFNFEDMDIDELVALRDSMLGDSERPVGHGFGGRSPGMQSGTSSGGTSGASSHAVSSVRVGESVTRVGGNNMTIGGTFGEQTTAVHDIDTGARISRLSHLETLALLGANSDGDVFAMQGHSILRHGANGYVDVLLDGTAFAFGAPDSSTAAIQNIGESLIVNVNVAGQHNRLFKYIWDENAMVSLDKTISIWSLYDNALVRAAITEIWRQNPDADITYEIALSGDTAMSASDAVRTLNTRLLSGSGPDILILDGAPIDSYAGRGMLLDLTGRVDTGDMYQNLLTPYINNGQMHVIPTQFSIPVLMGSERTLGELPSLAAFVESIVNGNPAMAGDGRVMFGGVPEAERAQTAFNNVEELFDIMWQANASAFIDDNQLDSAVLREFLGAIEAISNMYELTEQDEMGRMGFMSVSTVGGGRVNILPGSLMRYMMHSTNVAAFSVNNLMLLQGAIVREGDAAREVSEFVMFPGLVQGAWQPSTIVGVSADTNAEDFAIAFVNTMLSLEVQQINHGEGLPVTQRGIYEQIATLNEMLEMMDITFDIDMDTLIGQLRIPTIIEATLRGMIWETVERLANGRLDLEGAVREVEQNLRNYLAERS